MDTNNGETITAHFNFGDVLPNGGIVITSAPSSPNEGIVLAYFNEQFVTWAYQIGIGPVDTFWGHYFDSIISAADDYAGRTGSK